jgi:hypothetical protein
LDLYELKLNFPARFGVESSPPIIKFNRNPLLSFGNNHTGSWTDIDCKLCFYFEHLYDEYGFAYHIELAN